MKKNYLPASEISFFLHLGGLHANSQERMFGECATFLQRSDQCDCISMQRQNSTKPTFTCHVSAGQGWLAAQMSCGEATEAVTNALGEEIICGTLWRFIVGRIKWSGEQPRKKSAAFFCAYLINRWLWLEPVAWESVCFLPVVVDVIECSCWAFLHGVLCLGKVQC